MPSSQTIHTFKTHNIRSVFLDGAPWFSATDLCVALFPGFNLRAGTYQNLRHLDPDQRQLLPLPTAHGNCMGKGRTRPQTVVSESGLYLLTLRAQRSNPEAREFQDWVTREALPSIRKTGSYSLADHGRDQMPGDVGNMMLTIQAELSGLRKLIEDMRSEPKPHELWVGKPLRSMTTGHLHALVSPQRKGAAYVTAGPRRDFITDLLIERRAGDEAAATRKAERRTRDLAKAAEYEAKAKALLARINA